MTAVDTREQQPLLAFVSSEADLRAEQLEVRIRHAERVNRAAAAAREAEQRAAAEAQRVAAEAKAKAARAAAVAAARRSEAAQSKPAAKPKAPSAPARPVTAGSGSAAQVVAFAWAQIGKPYVWASAGPNSYDCSGLAKAAYATVGISIPHQTGGIVGRGWQVGRSELRPGDLVFPSSGHVGIYIGNNQMIHAPQAGQNVKVGSVYAFWTARRLL